MTPKSGPSVQAPATNTNQSTTMQPLGIAQTVALGPVTGETTAGNGTTIPSDTVHVDNTGGTFSATHLPSAYPLPSTGSTTSVEQVESLSQFKVSSTSQAPSASESTESLDTGNSLALSGGSSSINSNNSDTNLNNSK